MKRVIVWVAVAMLGGLETTVSASAAVVADDACPKYAVDIAGFATCDGDRVAKPEPALVSTTARSSPQVKPVEHVREVRARDRPTWPSFGPQNAKWKTRCFRC